MMLIEQRAPSSLPLPQHPSHPGPPSHGTLRDSGVLADTEQGSQAAIDRPRVFSLPLPEGRDAEANEVGDQRNQ